MRPFFKLYLLRPLALVNILVALGALADEQSPDYRCELILGDWSGIYEEDGNQIYQFDSALDEDGSIMVDFRYFNSGETDRHEGYWLCDNGILTTGMVTRWGGSILYHYEILYIDRERMDYRMVSPRGAFDSFSSRRVGARPMLPEILDN